MVLSVRARRSRAEDTDRSPAIDKRSCAQPPIPTAPAPRGCRTERKLACVRNLGEHESTECPPIGRSRAGLRCASGRRRAACARAAWKSQSTYSWCIDCGDEGTSYIASTAHSSARKGRRRENGMGGSDTDESLPELVASSSDEADSDEEASSTRAPRAASVSASCCARSCPRHC